MATVVLVGFSTAGKSSILSNATYRWASLTALDSDLEIARGFTAGGVPHIFAIYSQLGRVDAIAEIARRENEFLSRLERSSAPVLVAAGPGTLIRAEWTPFVARVSPTIVYISQTVNEAYAGLRQRREDHKSSPVAYAPNFGCWDEGTMTERVGESWVDVEEAVGLVNVAQEMNGLDKIYGQFAHKVFKKNELWKDQEPILRFIGSKLGLT
jgi:shikimate kinase